MIDNQKIVDAILQEPVPVTITVDKPTFLHKVGILPKKRTFIVSTLHPATVYRISAIVNTLKNIDCEQEKVEENGKMVNKIKNARQVYIQALSNMETDMPKLVEIVAFGLTNCVNKPDEKLKTFIAENTGDSFYKLYEMTISKMNVQGFITSIISVIGVSQLTGEIIASEVQSGESSEDSLNTTDAPLNMPSGE